MKLQSFPVASSNAGTPLKTSNLFHVTKLCWVLRTSTNADLAQHWSWYT